MFPTKLGATLIVLVTAALWLSGGRAAAAPSAVVLTPLPPAEQQPGQPLALAAPADRQLD